MRYQRILLISILVGAVAFAVLQYTDLLDASALVPPSVQSTQSSDEQPAHQSEEEHTESAANSQTQTAARQTSVHVIRTATTEDGTYGFDPHLLHVEPVDTVRWVVASGKHTTTAYHPANRDHPRRIPEEAEPWDSGTLTEDGTTTFERTLTVEGVYDCFCMPHEANRMVGTLVVGTAGGGPGLSDPQAQLPTPTQETIAELNATVQREFTRAQPEQADR